MNQLNYLFAQERTLRQKAVQLRKAHRVLQYNVDKFNSQSALQGGVYVPLMTAEVSWNMFNRSTLAEKQRAVVVVLQRIQQPSVAIQSSKQAISNQIQLQY